MRTRPRFLRFSLRGLLIAVTLFAIPLAIIASYIRRAERQRYIIGEVKRLGGTIFYADEHSIEGYERDYVSEKDLSALRKRLGDGYYRTIDFVDISPADEVPDELFAAIAALPELRGLEVSPKASLSAGMSLVTSTHPRLELHVEWRFTHTFGEAASIVDELDAALAADYCLLFVDGDWSRGAVAARPVLARFARSWTQKGELPAVSFVAVDLSDRLETGYVATHEWIDSEAIPRSALEAEGRVGMVIWIKEGRVKDFRWNAHELSQDELFRLTRAAFSPSENE